MGINEIINKLEKNIAVFDGLFKNISNEQVHWKPNKNKWSMLEILCHLLDEEKEDFRQRVDFTLHKPGQTWPSIDPPGWVKSRKYSDKDFGETFSKFLCERENSVKWLKTIQTKNWQNSYQHPIAGEVSARQLLANWLAHDLLHIRQITELNFIYLKEMSSPLKLDYAGNW